MSNYLNWRYATKKFDPTKKISQTELEELLEVLRLSPSSFGLQPWKFILVNDPALRQEVKKHAWNQDQVTDASHLIVLCSLKEMSETHIKSFVLDMAHTRGVTPESLSGYEQIMVEAVKSKSSQDVSSWMKRQVYIALGMLLSSCALKKIDACPMEGFDPKKVEEVLGLEKLGIESVALCPVGYRSHDDKYASLPKVRFSQKDVILRK